jgi:ribosome maturation factor RimP
VNIEPQIQAVEHKVDELIGADPDVFLVEIKIRPTNNIKIYIDGDQGVSIERLVQYNRNLYRRIEEDNLFPNGDFSLEVSSPGLEEPLKLFRQYQKNTGRFVEVLDKEGIKKEGKLVNVSEQHIELEEVKGKGKKTEIIHHIISFDSIKTTKIQIKF